MGNIKDRIKERRDAQVSRVFTENRVILKSKSGIYWRIEVDDAGKIVVTNLEKEKR